MGKRPLCWLCFLLIGGILLLYAIEGPDMGRLKQQPLMEEYLTSHSQAVWVCGTVFGRSPDGKSVSLKNSYLKTQSEIISLENLIIYLKEPTKYPAGAFLLACGKLEAIAEVGNPGQFDSRFYYRVRQVHYRMTKGEARIVKEADFSLRERVLQLRERLCLSLEEAAGEKAPVYEAMLLGEKSSLSNEVRDLYQMGGMMHLLTISGLHLSLLGAGCGKLLRATGAPKAAAGMVSILLMFLYGILAGEGVALLRALVMFSLAMGAQMLDRSYDLLSAAALSAMLLLLQNPLYLFYSGFLLSYGCILGLALISPLLGRAFRPKWDRKKASHKLFLALLSGFSIQAATLPLTLSFFYEYPLYGILLNLAAVPALAIVLVSGLGGAVAGCFQKTAASLFLLPGNGILAGYEKLGALAGRLPATFWCPGKPRTLQIILYYLLLLVFLFMMKRIGEGGWSVRRRRQKKQNSDMSGEAVEGVKTDTTSMLGISLPALLTLAAFSGLAFLVLSNWEPPGDSITVLDVGQGDCSVLTSKEGGVFLIDGGSSNVKEAGRQRLLPCLKSRGIRQIDGAFVSHTDSDHISALLELLQQQEKQPSSVSISRLYLPSWREEPENYVELVEQAKRAGTKITCLKKDDILSDGHLQIRVLWEGERGGDNANEEGLVLLCSWGAFDALFPGDAGEETERAMASRLPKVEFLKVAHHGSRYSTTEDFLARTKPMISVVSSSAANTYGHPHPDTLKRLAAADSQVFCTKDTGAVTVKIGEKEVKIKTTVQKRHS